MQDYMVGSLLLKVIILQLLITSIAVYYITVAFSKVTSNILSYIQSVRVVTFKCNILLTYITSIMYHALS